MMASCKRLRSPSPPFIEHKHLEYSVYNFLFFVCIIILDLYSGGILLDTGWTSKMPHRGRLGRMRKLALATVVAVLLALHRLMLLLFLFQNHPT